MARFHQIVLSGKCGISLKDLCRGQLGSGVTEAACKTLVKQRLGGAGMRWTSRGAHVVLQLRAAALTNNRWNAFWRKISLHGVMIEARLCCLIIL